MSKPYAVSDAIRLLVRAGYVVRREIVPLSRRKNASLTIGTHAALLDITVKVNDGHVDAAEIDALAKRGVSADDHKRREEIENLLRSISADLDRLGKLANTALDATVDTNLRVRCRRISRLADETFSRIVDLL